MQMWQMCVKGKKHEWGNEGWKGEIKGNMRRATIGPVLYVMKSPLHPQLSDLLICSVRPQGNSVIVLGN